MVASQVVRDKAVIKPASGTRKCKCKQKLVTRQLGPGMYQQYTTNVCEDCPNVKLEREQEHITVHVEPGMTDMQVSEADRAVAAWASGLGGEVI